MFDGLDVLRKELCPWPCVVTDPKGAVIPKEAVTKSRHCTNNFNFQFPKRPSMAIVTQSRSYTYAYGLV